jgi:hypothetical protein
MQPVSRQRIGKHSSITRELLLETVFCTRSVQSGYKEENWGNHFSWALQGRLRRDGAIISWRVGSMAVKRRIFMCCSYSETGIISVLSVVRYTTSED